MGTFCEMLLNFTLIEGILPRLLLLLFMLLFLNGLVGAFYLIDLLDGYDGFVGDD